MPQIICILAVLMMAALLLLVLLLLSLFLSASLAATSAATSSFVAEECLASSDDSSSTTAGAAAGAAAAAFSPDSVTTTTPPSPPPSDDGSSPSALPFAYADSSCCCSCSVCDFVVVLCTSPGSRTFPTHSSRYRTTAFRIIITAMLIWSLHVRPCRGALAPPNPPNDDGYERAVSLTPPPLLPPPPRSLSPVRLPYIAFAISSISCCCCTLEEAVVSRCPFFAVTTKHRCGSRYPSTVHVVVSILVVISTPSWFCSAR
mmetsp:Transcript_11704/g.26523  ORF Transcript_11704/g.26523 Transcript_11704/m.26523 type:complete len:259 (+) Transcript_11704:736-1512(+)